VGSLYMGTIGLMLGKTIVETEKKLWDGTMEDDGLLVTTLACLICIIRMHIDSFVLKSTFS
jgi:hypothetical protein